MKIKYIITSLSLLFTSHLHASNILSHEASQSELNFARKSNFKKFQLNKTREKVPVPFMPIADDAEYSYVLLSGVEFWNLEIRELRKRIASNLPENVKLVVLTSPYYANYIHELYSEWIEPNRLILAIDSDPDTENGFWARDSFPIPVRNKENNNVSLIAHQYFRDFNSFQIIANSVHSPMITRDEVFVGGNLLSDDEANCFVVDSVRLFDMDPEDVKSVYGCNTMTVFEHLTGIGDIDEVLKPIKHKVMLTNEPKYVDRLEAMGYKIIMLPQIKGTYRTYVNSLIVGKTVFMPVYGIREDSQAQKVYEDIGYKVVPIPSNVLSDLYKGSIHCQTMAYPAIEQKQLFSSMGLARVQALKTW